MLHLKYAFLKGDKRQIWNCLKFDVSTIFFPHPMFSVLYMVTVKRNDSRNLVHYFPWWEFRTICQQLSVLSIINSKEAFDASKLALSIVFNKAGIIIITEGDDTQHTTGDDNTNTSKHRERTPPGLPVLLLCYMSTRSVTR